MIQFVPASQLESGMEIFYWDPSTVMPILTVASTRHASATIEVLVEESDRRTVFHPDDLLPIRTENHS